MKKKYLTSQIILDLSDRWFLTVTTVQNWTLRTPVYFITFERCTITQILKYIFSSRNKPVRSGIRVHCWSEPRNCPAALANPTTVNVTSFQLRSDRNCVQKSGSGKQPKYWWFLNQNLCFRRNVGTGDRIEYPPALALWLVQHLFNSVSTNGIK